MFRFSSTVSFLIGNYKSESSWYFLVKSKKFRKVKSFSKVQRKTKQTKNENFCSKSIFEKTNDRRYVKI